MINHARFVANLDLGKAAFRQSALIKTKGKFHPVQFTAGVPHRLTAWVKAASEVEVKVVLAGTFDGQPLARETTVTAGPAWVEVALPFTPPATLTATLALTVTAPRGVVVYLDEVRFVPE